MSVWGGCSATQKHRVQKVLNFAARIVCDLNRRQHVTPALDELRWQKVEEMISEHDLISLRRMVCDCHAPVILRGQIARRSDVSTRDTRGTDSTMLQLPRVRTEFARRSFMFRASSKWNSLPVDVRDSALDGDVAFKASLKSFLNQM